ncbi:MAG: HAD-IA family hydrolase [Gemmatimonadota bacterium]
MRPVIVFDLDGTLVDSLPDIAASFLHVFAAAGLPAPSEAELWGRLGGPLEATFAAFAPEASVDELCARYREHYALHLAERSRPFAGVPALLRELGRRGYLRAVATTKRTVTARRLIEAVGLADVLDHVEGSDAPPYKPAPDVVLRALEALPGRGLWMVGDTSADVLAGRAAGLATYAVTWGVRDVAPLDACAPTRLEPDLDALLQLCPDAGQELTAPPRSEP